MVAVTREPMPAPLKRAVERFEADLQAIGYVSHVNPIHGIDRIEVVAWDCPDGHRCAYRDFEGWYGYGD